MTLYNYTAYLVTWEIGSAIDNYYLHTAKFNSLHDLTSNFSSACLTEADHKHFSFNTNLTTGTKY